MKPATVFLGEMTNPEVEAFLRDHQTILVPTGSTEQHGPHGPLLTDVLVPQEVARRIATEVGALVAPPINYALSYPHAGFTGVVHIRIPTFMALVEDLCVSLATAGFRRIVLPTGFACPLVGPPRRSLRARVLRSEPALVLDLTLDRCPEPVQGGASANTRVLPPVNTQASSRHTSLTGAGPRSRPRTVSESRVSLRSSVWPR